MSETGRARIDVAWYSDVLCIWAYVGQVRLDEVLERYGPQVRIDSRCVPVFGNTARKIGEGWKDRGGFEGYAAHVREIGERYDHVELHPDVWTREIPAGSLAPHAFLRAVGLVTGDAEAGGRPLLVELSWRMRLAFFRDLRDISRLDVQLDVAGELDLPADATRARLEDGTAQAALSADHELAARHGVTGSPTYVLDGGRQTLYGNVGYRVIEANIAELLRDNGDKASWC
jgi:predicted DsbA family dithiol-disulfide isomerase